MKIWFQNRRAKERKQVKKRDELMTKDKIDVSGISVHPSHMAAMSGIWSIFEFKCIKINIYSLVLCLFER